VLLPALGLGLALAAGCVGDDPKAVVVDPTAPDAATSVPDAAGFVTASDRGRRDEVLLRAVSDPDEQ